MRNTEVLRSRRESRRFVGGGLVQEFGMKTENPPGCGNRADSGDGVVAEREASLSFSGFSQISMRLPPLRALS